ncbi:hypothetical protein SDC9_146658 [bioreactor metagenome]|uniref:DUF4044 domain-containing protein n=1 Tax=bioreactor metagenome TaxID=1076179 RepID=A0A645EBW5_9ZZZZ
MKYRMTRNERRRHIKLVLYAIGWVVLIVLFGALLIGGVPIV